MSSYNFFTNKSILVIENSSVEINKTWCFWTIKIQFGVILLQKNSLTLGSKNIDTEIDYDLKELSV